MTKQKAVIFDMDGSLVDVNTIRHHVLDRRRRNYKAFHYLSTFCPPFDWVRDLAQKYHDEGVVVLVVTARKNEWRAVSSAWLEQNTVPYRELHMRKQNDDRKDKVIKSEILDLLLLKYEIIHAVDDNPNVIELWTERGIPTTVVPGWSKEYINTEKETA